MKNKPSPNHPWKTGKFIDEIPSMTNAVDLISNEKKSVRKYIPPPPKELMDFPPNKPIRKIQTELIMNEIENPALKSMVASIANVIERAQDDDLAYAEANVEINAHKHLIQLITLDWARRELLKKGGVINGKI